MSTLASTIGYGVTGSRPAAGEEGRLYFDTDASVLYRDNGSTWDSVSPSALTNPMTTEGDIIYASDGSGTPARLAAVAAGKLLKSAGTGTAPVYGYPPFHGAKAYHNTTQTAVSAQILALNSEEYDTDGFHDNSTNNSRLTIPSGMDGYYLVIGNARWTTVTANVADVLALIVDGSTSYASQGTQDAAASLLAIVNVSQVLYLTAGQYVELRLINSGSGTITVAATGNYSPYLSISLIGV